MTVSTVIEDARSTLEQLLRRWKFKRENAEREKAADLQAALAICRGKLETCKKDFNRIIKEQSKNISEGMSIGADTTIQERILWDAAIGYMLVKEAIFSLKSINSFDSVAHAYEIMGIAIEKMTERERKLPRFPKFSTSKERNSYGHLTSNASLKKKEDLLDSFFETLKRTGDIEECLNTSKSPAAIAGDRRANYTDPSRAGSAETGGRWSVLDADEDDNGDDMDDTDLSSFYDIHPPTE